MATRAPPKRAQPSQKAEQKESAESIQFKLLLREEALEVKDISETKTTPIYDLCRVKANQVAMMKNRGYKIPEEESVWIEASKSEETLVKHIRTLLNLSSRELLNLFQKKYTIRRSFIQDQLTFNFYPYLESEGTEEMKIGEFFFRGGNWEKTRTEEEIVSTRDFVTEVVFTDKISLDDFDITNFSGISTKIVVYTDSEKKFQQEVMKNMIEYRKRGIEIFHTSELFIDYFQHWLVPSQRILEDVERIQLLSPYLMIKDEKGVFHKEFNSRILEAGLPSIHHTDIVMRFLGALPGKIIYWENDSYISSFSTKEFGYMMVSGYKYKTATTHAEEMFAGEKRPLEEPTDDLEEDIEQEEEMEDAEDLGGDLGDDED